MKTIYDEFIECHLDRSTNVQSNPTILKQLRLLFLKSYGIDLFKESDTFIPDSASIGEKLTINYKFKYGTVSISTKSDGLEVVFYHLKSLFKAPFDTNRCVVSVDHDLNFIRAEFCVYFSFSNKINYKQVKIHRVIDLERTYNQLSFRKDNKIYFTSSGERGDVFLEVSHEKISEHFVIPNTDLEESLYRILDFVTEKPDEFYEIFTGYPSFSECVNISESIIEFINLFVYQYVNDNENLKNNMLLIEMENI
jgi:hypothetical protein